MEQEEKLQLFISLTGTEKTDLALQILEQNNWDIETSVDFYFNTKDIVDTTSQFNGKTSDNKSSPVGSKSPPLIDQEEEDFREPIPQMMDTLVEASFPVIRPRRQNGQDSTNVFESFRDYEKEAGLNQNKTKLTGKQKTLSELFRPPLELLSFGSFDEVKQKAKEAKRFLLVNLQDVSEFSCQRLNRDTWSNAKLKELIGGNLVMWQVNCQSEEGKWFSQYYHPTEFPYISLIDPRTGEELANTVGFVEAEEMLGYLNKFLLINQFNSKSALPPSEINKNLKKKKYFTEEEELELAIQLSLGSKPTESENEQKPTTTTTNNIQLPTTSTTTTTIEQPNKKLKKEIEEVDLDEEDEEDEDDNYGDLDKYDNKQEKMEIEKKSEEQPSSTIGLEGDCTIQIKLPDQTIKGNFQSTDLIKNVYYFVQLKSGKFNFKLFTTFPKVELTGPIMQKTLKEMDLTPRAQLMFQQE